MRESCASRWVPFQTEETRMYELFVTSILLILAAKGACWLIRSFRDQPRQSLPPERAPVRPARLLSDSTELGNPQWTRATSTVPLITPRETRWDALQTPTFVRRGVKVRLLPDPPEKRQQRQPAEVSASLKAQDAEKLIRYLEAEIEADDAGKPVTF